MVLTSFVPRFVRVTVAFGTLAPVESVTVPVMSPVVLCAVAMDAAVKLRQPVSRRVLTLERNLGSMAFFEARDLAMCFIVPLCHVEDHSRWSATLRRRLNACFLKWQLPPKGALKTAFPSRKPGQHRSTHVLHARRGRHRFPRRNGDVEELRT